MASLTGSLSAYPDYLANAWQQPAPAEADAGVRAARYLRVLRDLAINPYWIGLSESGADCSQAMESLGLHIDGVNQQLDDILQECLACFHPEKRPAVQILAAPIVPRAGLDGFCNLEVQPITLMVDPSRIMRADWNKLVIHELAHGMARSAGHGETFRDALSHLCLAFDLPEPPGAASAQVLQSWPPYQTNPAWATFWLFPA
jgi:hypothetical protein